MPGLDDEDGVAHADKCPDQLRSDQTAGSIPEEPCSGCEPSSSIAQASSIFLWRQHGYPPYLSCIKFSDA